jgi:hypothetical protein
MSSPVYPDYREVLEHVRAFAVSQPGSFDIWAPRWELSGAIPGAEDSTGTLTRAYLIQTLRAVGTLTEDGTLVKTGSGRGARYRTPEARERELKSAREARQASQELQNAWQRVKTRLAGHGITGSGGGELDIRLDLGTWEDLLGKLERLGKERRSC